MTPEPFVPDAAPVLARPFRFKWIALCGIAVFVGVYSIHLWLARHGFRAEARILDDLLVAVLVVVLLLIQRLHHERELKRHARMMAIIGDMNHHIRNALQVILGTIEQGKPALPREALDDISASVQRIEWCLREVLPHASESAKPDKVAVRTDKSGRYW
jgi:signal transduction histidine kinase